MLPSQQKDLFAYVDRHLFSYLDAWRRLYTLGYTLPTQNIQEFCHFCWQRYGFQTRFLDPECRFLYAESPQTPSQVSQMEHDAVSPHTLLFYAELPSEAKLDHAFIYPFLASLIAYTCYQSLPGLPAFRLKWLLASTASDAREESTLLTHVLQDHQQTLQADGCIIYTLRSELNTNMAVPQIILGTKGLLQVKMTLQTAQQTIPAHYGAIMPNAAWQLLWAINSLKDYREDILIDGFYDPMVACDDRALAMLDTLPATASADPAQWGVAHAIAGLEGKQQHYAYFLTPTCSVTSFQSPTPATPARQHHHTAALPHEAQATLDFRLVPQQDPQDIFIRLQQHLVQQGYPQIQTHLLTAQPPAMMAADDLFFQLVHQALESSYQAAPVIIPLGAALPAFPALLKHVTPATIAIVPPPGATLPAGVAPDILAAHVSPFIKGLLALFLAGYTSH